MDETPNNQSQNQIVKSKAIKMGKILGFEFWIVKHPIWERSEANKAKTNPKVYKILKGIEDSSGYNGYVLFPKRPVRERGYDGILAYVPVHGGITYANEDKMGMVYGFDTGHCHSSKFPVRNFNWIKGQIHLMIKGIVKAAQVERNYLKCLSNRGKAKWAQSVFEVGKKYRKTDDLGFSAMINLLLGKI